VTLPPALPGERISLPGLNAYRTGQGPPLLLVHSINATGSAAEVRPLYEHFAATRTVFAIDLPGYGFSDRSERPYTPRLMTDALHTLAAHVAQQFGSAPLDAMALSLSCEFLARAAVEKPAHWGRLALVSPTGFVGFKPRRGPPGSTRVVPWLYRLLSNPRWAQGLFRNLTRPSVVRYFLRRTWGSRGIDPVMYDYALLTAQAPGARHAPLYFLGGALFSADIHNIYGALTQPLWVTHGVRGDFTDYRGLAAFAKRPNWQVQVMTAGALPYFEVPDVFMPAMERFLAGAVAAP
jgi:pimeloyl-ACP methyl ester carboxylesterase